MKTTLNREQRIALINEMLEHYKALNAIHDQIKAIFSPEPEAPYFDANWRMFDAYSRLVAKEVGDEADWLSWFIYENACGEKGFSASSGPGDMMIPIKTVEQLDTMMHWNE